MKKTAFENYLGFEVPSVILEYSVIRRKFYDLAWLVFGQFVKDYENNFPNIDVLMDKGTTVVIEYLKPVVRQAVEELVKNGVYDVSIDFFIEQYIPQYFEWELAYNEIFEKYAKICMDESEAKQFREDRKNNRDRWGVFTTSDKYFEAQIEKGMLNLYDGIGHSIRNVIGNAISKSIANSEKKELFDQDDTAVSLMVAVYTTCFNIHYALIDALNDNRDIKLPDFEQFDSAAPTIERMIQNLTNNLIPANDVGQVIVKLLNSDPFEIDIYDYLYKSGRNSFVEVAEMADVISLDVSELVFESNTNVILQGLDSLSLEAKEKLYISMKDIPTADTSYEDVRIKIMNQCLVYKDVQYIEFSEIRKLMNPPTPLTTTAIGQANSNNYYASPAKQASSTPSNYIEQSAVVISEKIGCGYLMLAWWIPLIGIIISLKWKKDDSKQVIAAKLLKFSIIFMVVQVVLLIILVVSSSG